MVFPKHKGRIQHFPHWAELSEAGITEREREREREREERERGRERERVGFSQLREEAAFRTHM